MTLNPAIENHAAVITVRPDREPGSLWRWLGDDPDAHALLTGFGGPADDEQQGTFEVINTVVANGLALSSLVVAVAGWRDRRRAVPPTVTLERDGVVIDVTGASAAEIAAIARALGIPEDDEPA
ncbi:hypothetical protein OG439_18940 [Amycolatopsis sp. NBC_01307]|uniref:effector-associated constant component EACC1 n=1 Tax=Amycolatopsis sp. NBC_01307 TaxID=2903561 RepID=UPI002E12C2E4|nr:hypothetical protein OG439_18940 [Amycolatopsis sp. NBC_01307]